MRCNFERHVADVENTWMIRNKVIESCRRMLEHWRTGTNPLYHSPSLTRTLSLFLTLPLKYMIGVDIYILKEKWNGIKRHFILINPSSFIISWSPNNTCQIVVYNHWILKNNEKYVYMGKYNLIFLFINVDACVEHENSQREFTHTKELSGVGTSNGNWLQPKF